MVARTCCFFSMVTHHIMVVVMVEKVCLFHGNWEAKQERCWSHIICHQEQPQCPDFFLLGPTFSRFLYLHGTKIGDQVFSPYASREHLRSKTEAIILSRIFSTYLTLSYELTHILLKSMHVMEVLFLR